MASQFFQQSTYPRHAARGTPRTLPSSRRNIAPGERNASLEIRIAAVPLESPQCMPAYPHCGYTFGVTAPRRGIPPSGGGRLCPAGVITPGKGMPPNCNKIKLLRATELSSATMLDLPAVSSDRVAQKRGKSEMIRGARHHLGNPR